MHSLTIRYQGDIAKEDTNPIKVTVLAGLLETLTEERVNMVNADFVADSRGLKVTEQKDSTCENYANLITLEVTTTVGVTTVSGTVLRGETHIVQVNNYWIEIVPTGGYFLFIDHLDRPGIIGAVGKIAGDADINISYMHVNRLNPRGPALTILALDEDVPEEQQQQILAIPDVYSVKVVKL